MKRPLFIVLIFYLVGIISYELIEINISYVLFTFVIFLYIYIKFGSKFMIISFLIFLFGYIHTQNQDMSHIKGENLKLKFEILNIKDTQFGYRYGIRIFSISDKKANVYSYFYDSQNYKIDDVLEAEGDFRKIYGKKNFRTFNLEKYFKTKKIFFETKITTKKVIYNQNKLKTQISGYIASNLEKNLKNNSKEILKTMILNKSSDNEDEKMFREVGLAHILAISGLHLNILIQFLEKIGENTRLKKGVYGFFIVGILVFYGYIIDYPISIIRAITMYIFEIFSIQFNKIYDNLNAIFLSAVVVLLLNPYFIYSASFYFTFFAVFGIFYVDKKFENIWKSKFKSIHLIISIQMAILPFQLYYFNEFNPLNLVTNILIVPFVKYFLVGGITISFWGIYPIKIFVENLYDFFIFVVNIFVNINTFTLRFKSFSILEFFVYFLILIFLLNYKKVYRKFQKFKNISISIVALILIYIFVLQFNKPIKINFIDIGQGDSALIRTKDKVFMIDTGGNPFNLEFSSDELMKYLLKNGIYSIDGVLISHGDMDHVGNLIYLQHRFEMKNIYYNNQKDDRIKNKKILKNGEKITLDNFEIEVHKDGIGVDKSNDSSMVLIVRVFDKVFLFTGDIEKNEEHINVKEKIDFLKVAHHGSKYSTKEEFLDRHRIEKAIISVGKNNYGHPAKEVMDRLKNRNIEFRRTDTDGNIEVSIYRNGWEWRYYQEKINLWKILKRIIYFRI